MAEAIPFGVAANVLTMLRSAAFDQIGKIYGVKKDLKKLESTLSTIKAALVDADAKQEKERREKGELVRNWIRELKEVVYEADDVLDAFATKALHRNLDADDTVIDRVKHQVREFFSSSNPIAFRIKMAKKVKEIRERMDEIAANMSKFNFGERIVQIGAQNRERGQTHSYVPDSEVIGRDKDKEEIINWLQICSSNNQEKLSLIAIVGIGGLGKTTIAQLVYNDDRVIQFFELRMWVCVSQDFDVKILVEKLIRSATGLEVGNVDMDQLQRRLRETIRDKRFLLVLDDVWNENNRRWDDLKNLLVGGSKGSSIIVTTRSRTVASVMGAENPYVLEGLTEDKSWALFEKLAFRGRHERVLPSLITIGKDIVKKCKGVPLAIRTLGSVMQSKSGESGWLSIQNNEIWMLPQDDNDIMPVLRLSYEHLPIHLRQCFSYCSTFSKDSTIFKQELIQLWMAQGYIQSSGENELEEDTGEQYFEDLLSRSFFQEVEEDEFGNIECCKMHDLIHDLSQSVAGTNCLIGKSGAENKISERVHHVSLKPGLWPDFLRQLLKAKGLRTILQVDYRELNESSHSYPMVLSNFKSLRVLDLSVLNIKILPNSIGKLKHLRHLDLSWNRKIKRLPSSVCDLHNLQTLNLTHCVSLIELPTNTRKLVNLVYLMIIDCYALTHMPVGLGKLISLQQLPRFIVHKTNWRLIKRAGTLNELKGLNNLRGELELEHLQKVRDVALESKDVNLKEKKYLQLLILGWSSRQNEAQNSELLLDNLQPHPNLKELEVYGYEGIRFSGWLSSITNLVSITIWKCERCTSLPPLDQLPFLKTLFLLEMTALEYVDDGSKKNFSSSSTVFFPSLAELRLYRLPNLKGWMRSRKELINEAMTDLHHWESRLFPCLSQLLIDGCPKLTSIPLLPNLKELTLENSSVEIMVAPEFPEVESAPMASSSLALPLSSPFPKLESLLIRDVQDCVSLSEEGLPNLTSLMFLTIKNCLNLKSLPEGMHCLTSLQSLEIIGCSHITERCQVDKEDWSKIAHIPSINIK